MHSAPSQTGDQTIRPSWRSTRDTSKSRKYRAIKWEAITVLVVLKVTAIYYIIRDYSGVEQKIRKIRRRQKTILNYIFLMRLLSVKSQ